MRKLNFKFVALMFISLFVSCQSDDLIETGGELSPTSESSKLIKLNSGATVELKMENTFGKRI